MSAARAGLNPAPVGSATKDKDRNKVSRVRAIVSIKPCVEPKVAPSPTRTPSMSRSMPTLNQQAARQDDCRRPRDGSSPRRGRPRSWAAS